MSLRSDGTIAKIWSIEPKQNSAKIKISTSKKNKETNKYETTFSSFAICAGQAFQTVKKLKENDYIKITRFDISNNYDKEKKVTYTNLVIWECEEFSFESFNSNKNDLPY